MVCRIIVGLCMGLWLGLGPVYAGHELSLDEKVRELKRNLELTDAQVEQIRPIMQTYKHEVDRARQRKEDSLKSVLSPQQMNILKKLDEENLQGGLPK